MAYKQSAGRCWPYTLQLQHEMQPHVFHIVKRFNLVFMAVCAEATNHLDTSFIDKCVSGFQMVGHMPDSCCHRLKPFAATEDSTVDRHTQNKRLIASITRRGKKATVKTSWICRRPYKLPSLKSRKVGRKAPTLLQTYAHDSRTVFG